MHRVPRTSNVRRRLFPDDDVTTQAKVDNTTNYLQESIEQDIRQKIQKWNFDFENDVPLEGVYEWTPCIDDSHGWIGRKRNLVEKDDILQDKDDLLAETHDMLAEKHESLDQIIVVSETVNNSEDLSITEDNVKIEKEPILSIKELNEITPRNYRVEDLPIRKRKNEIIDGKDLDKAVRRKISFD